MRKFAIFMWLNFALIFSACSMKNTQKIDFYELNFKKSKQNLQCNMDLPQIFLTKTDALELGDSRNFIVFDENSVQRSVNSAKFIQRPSAMIDEMMIAALKESCVYMPVFSSKIERKLSVKLLKFGVFGDRARVQIAYEISDENSLIKSAIIEKSEFVKTPDAMAIFNALNLSTNRAISDILEQIKGIK